VRSSTDAAMLILSAFMSRSSTNHGLIDGKNLLERISRCHGRIKLGEHSFGILILAIGPELRLFLLVQKARHVREFALIPLRQRQLRHPLGPFAVFRRQGLRNQASIDAETAHCKPEAVFRP
jgi:hypothetical protein